MIMKTYVDLFGIFFIVDTGYVLYELRTDT